MKDGSLYDEVLLRPRNRICHGRYINCEIPKDIARVLYEISHIKDSIDYVSHVSGASEVCIVMVKSMLQVS